MIKKFTLCALLTFGIYFHNSVKADVVILESGGVMTGNVLQQDSDGVLIQLDYGTLHYPTSWIKDVKKEAVTSTNESSSGQRIPNWARIISVLATNNWADGLKQIPATVIDNGVLKDVPYISFRCASGGYEINIYGDLDNPSGVEIGVVNYLIKNDEAKSNCVAFISSVLANGDDQKIVGDLGLKQKVLTKKDGMTFETTFPDESDAYGGWWVSVYSEDSLAKARATGPELLAITQPRVEPPSSPVVMTSQSIDATSPPIATSPERTSWSADDFSYSRPSRSTSSSSGGEVYVRGYYRANGTYVNSYTRSSPHRR